jgi:positive regulator of sigma E activity
MLAIRLYISALTFIFLFVVISNRGLGFLEAIVITCALLFLILDIRTDLQSLKIEFRLLQELEQRISELRGQIS